MEPVHSFPPLSTPHARVLILGSMPGLASLRAQQYYAHPQNLFWRILGGLLDFDPKAPYPERTVRLLDAGLAVWDVLKSCEREGSLDSDIDPASVVPNDFERFLAQHPGIERVCFNGGAAYTLFQRHVLKRLPLPADLSYLRLPSTSPANASIPLATKQLAWREGLAPALG
jgi:double-stranded uracil-DNA glycosylase